MSLFGDFEYHLQIAVGIYIPNSWVMFNWDIDQPLYYNVVVGNVSVLDDDTTVMPKVVPVGLRCRLRLARDAARSCRGHSARRGCRSCPNGSPREWVPQKIWTCYYCV